MQIGIIQKVNEHHEPIQQCTKEVTQLYCNRHNYTYIIDTAEWDKSRSPRWIKYPALYRAMQNHPEIDWFMWLDADILIMNHDITLDSFVNTDKDFVSETFILPKTYKIEDIQGEVILTWCKGQVVPWPSIHAGCMLFRNCEWAQSFIHELYADHKFWRPDLSGLTESDELAITIYLMHYPGYKEHTKFVPLGSFLTTNERKYFPEGVRIYKDGDFMVHIAAYPVHTRVKILEEYKQRFYNATT